MNWRKILFDSCSTDPSFFFYFFLFSLPLSLLSFTWTKGCQEVIKQPGYRMNIQVNQISLFFILFLLSLFQLFFRTISLSLSFILIHKLLNVTCQGKILSLFSFSFLSCSFSLSLSLILIAWEEKNGSESKWNELLMRNHHKYWSAQITGVIFFLINTDDRMLVNRIQRFCSRPSFFSFFLSFFFSPSLKAITTNRWAINQE